MAGDTERISIGQVADKTGLSVHALRFFEREGLMLREVPRSNSGHRVYSAADVEWLLLCNRFRASGMPLATIRAFADLVRAGPGNEAQRLRLLQSHEEQVSQQIAALDDDLRIIQHKVAIYAQHVRDGTSSGIWDPTSTTPD